MEVERRHQSLGLCTIVDWRWPSPQNRIWQSKVRSCQPNAQSWVVEQRLK